MARKRVLSPAPPMWRGEAGIARSGFLDEPRKATAELDAQAAAGLRISQGNDGETRR